MAFDETLAARIRKALARKKGVEAKKTFGGLCFMLNGHMLVGVWKESMPPTAGPTPHPGANRLSSENLPESSFSWDPAD